MKSFTLSLLAITSFFSVAAHAQTAFSTVDSLGRLVYVKDGSTKHYMGYFCLERSKVESDNRKCLQAQFGMGEDVIRGVDALGNPSADLGSWKSFGPILTPESGKNFYNASLQSEAKEAFLEVWQDIWTREGYNWTSDPVKVSSTTWKKFLSLFESGPASALPEGSEMINEKDARKFIAGSTSRLSPYDGSVWFESSAKKLEMCIHVTVTSQYSSAQNYSHSKCFSEEENTLSYDPATQTLKALGVDGNPIVLSVIRKNGMTWMTLKMTMPPGSSFLQESTHDYHYYNSPDQIDIKLIKGTQTHGSLY